MAVEKDFDKVSAKCHPRFENMQNNFCHRDEKDKRNLLSLVLNLFTDEKRKEKEENCS